MSSDRTTTPSDTQFANEDHASHEQLIPEIPLNQEPAREIFSSAAVAASNKKLGVYEWASYHGVFSELLPISSRERDPIQIGIQIADGLSDLPPYQNTFRKDDLGLGRGAYEYTSRLFRFHSITPYDTSVNASQYRNPNYHHYWHCFDPITDRDERVRFYQNYIRGGAELSWIANHFGIDVPELRTFIRQKTSCLPPSTKLRDTRQLLAQTVYTAFKWGEWTLSEIAYALNINESHLLLWMQQYIVESDTNWRPPKDPTNDSDVST